MVIMILTEYTISPNWFFAIQDMYNYGNYDEEKDWIMQMYL